VVSQWPPTASRRRALVRPWPATWRAYRYPRHGNDDHPQKRCIRSSRLRKETVFVLTEPTRRALVHASLHQLPGLTHLPTGPQAIDMCT